MTSFAEPVVAWRNATDTDGPLVVLLHGRGSNEHDIIALADHLPDGVAYAAVRAPIGEGGGYAWFANRGIGRPLELTRGMRGALIALGETLIRLAERSEETARG